MLLGHTFLLNLLKLSQFMVTMFSVIFFMVSLNQKKYPTVLFIKYLDPKRFSSHLKKVIYINGIFFFILKQPQLLGGCIYTVGYHTNSPTL